MPCSSGVGACGVNPAIPAGVGAAGGVSEGASLRPNATLVAAEIPAPPRPPLRPALIKRSKFCGVKKLLLLSTNFSAAALDISWIDSVTPSETMPSIAPFPARLYQAPIISFSGMPDNLDLRSKLIGVTASNAALNPPNNNAAPRLSYPFSYSPWYTSGTF